MRVAALLLAAAVIASEAIAYSQDKEFETALRKSDPAALARLPAKGFRDGAAGFFRAYGLYVVPGSERAWCSDLAHGVLARGCYVEFSFQAQGLPARTRRGDFCGRIGRWVRRPGTTNYVPTPGATFSAAIAKGDAQAIESAIYDNVRANCTAGHRLGISTPAAVLGPERSAAPRANEVIQ